MAIFLGPIIGLPWSTLGSSVAQQGQQEEEEEEGNDGKDVSDKVADFRIQHRRAPRLSLLMQPEARFVAPPADAGSGRPFGPVLLSKTPLSTRVRLQI